MEFRNAVEIDNVKQQSLVNHSVRFTGPLTKRRSEQGTESGDGGFQISHPNGGVKLEAPR
jgi:hypothetical protein